MAEFCYNNHVSSATGYTPFFLWYGEHPSFQVGEPKEEKVPAAEELAKDIRDAMEEAKAGIRIAQEYYKEQADKHRTPEPDFAVGEEVWLNRKNMTTHRPAKKLDWKYLGPYKVLEKIGKRAWKLELPQAVKVHPVFHVNLLEKVTPDNFDRAPHPVPPVIVDGQEEWEVEKVLNSKKERNRIKYLVRWKGHGQKEDSWEPAVHLENAMAMVKKFHLENPNAAGSPRG